MNRPGYPDGVSQSVHDRAMGDEPSRQDSADPDDDERIAADRRRAMIDRRVADATEHSIYAAALAEEAEAALCLPAEATWFIGDVLNAVALSRVEASCFTDGDRLAALQARIERALRPIAERIVAEAA